jgi:hypothetical protein
MSIDCLRDRVSPLPNSNADQVWPVLLLEYAEIGMPWLSLALAPIPICACIGYTAPCELKSASPKPTVARETCP